MGETSEVVDLLRQVVANQERIASAIEHENAALANGLSRLVSASTEDPASEPAENDFPED